ncbi:MAG TPA: hypothetical protein VF787_11640 [Thermoanaerobaculia bacterium]
MIFAQSVVHLPSGAVLATLLGTPAGVHNRPNGLSSWRLVGGGKSGGYNALQINEVQGQFRGDNLRADRRRGSTRRWFS